MTEIRWQDPRTVEVFGLLEPYFRHLAEQRMAYRRGSYIGDDPEPRLLVPDRGEWRPHREVLQGGRLMGMTIEVSPDVNLPTVVPPESEADRALRQLRERIAELSTYSLSPARRFFYNDTIQAEPYTPVQVDTEAIARAAEQTELASRYFTARPFAPGSDTEIAWNDGELTVDGEPVDPRRDAIPPGIRSLLGLSE